MILIFFLLTQGVDSTSVNHVESTKHQSKRTPPTLWCRKFQEAYHIYDRLRLTYNNTPSPGWIVLRAAHRGTAFLREDTATGCPNARHLQTASGPAGPSSATKYILRLCCRPPFKGLKTPWWLFVLIRFAIDMENTFLAQFLCSSYASVRIEVLKKSARGELCLAGSRSSLPRDSAVGYPLLHLHARVASCCTDAIMHCQLHGRADLRHRQQGRTSFGSLREESLLLCIFLDCEECFHRRCSSGASVV